MIRRRLIEEGQRGQAGSRQRRQARGPGDAYREALADVQLRHALIDVSEQRLPRRRIDVAAIERQRGGHALFEVELLIQGKRGEQPSRGPHDRQDHGEERAEAEKTAGHRPTQPVWRDVEKVRLCDKPARR